VEDAGVKIGFYDCRENLRGIDKGGEGSFEEGYCLFVEFVACCNKSQRV
jgi:hypothetical protein